MSFIWAAQRHQQLQSSLEGSRRQLENWLYDEASGRPAASDSARVINNCGLSLSSSQFFLPKYATVNTNWLLVDIFLDGLGRRSFFTKCTVATAASQCLCLYTWIIVTLNWRRKRVAAARSPYNLSVLIYIYHRLFLPLRLRRVNYTYFAVLLCRS